MLARLPLHQTSAPVERGRASISSRKVTRIWLRAPDDGHSAADASAETVGGRTGQDAADQGNVEVVAARAVLFEEPALRKRKRENKIARAATLSTNPWGMVRWQLAFVVRMGLPPRDRF